MTGRAAIAGIGVALPDLRISVEHIHAAWENQPLDIVRRAGVRTRAVCDPDGDVVTLAAEAAELVLRSGPVSRDDVGAVFLGSQTAPYLTRASAAVVGDIVGLDTHTFATDLQFASKSGTAALLCAAAWVQAGNAPAALAIGADTLGVHAAPGDPLEYAAGSGAAAVLVTGAGGLEGTADGSEGVLAVIDGHASATSDTPDGFRQDGERYIRTGGAAMNATDVGMIDHCGAAHALLAERLGLSADGVRFVATSQPDAATPGRLAQRLGYRRDQAVAVCTAADTGDTGSASALIALTRALELADPGDRIVVVGYGAGAGADAVALTARRRPGHTGLGAALAAGRRVSYAEAVRAERRYAGHERLVGTFE